MTGYRIVGRVKELAEVQDRLEAARHSMGGCFVFSGEAGIGKTSLLEAVAAAASGFAVLRTRGIESDAELPFASLVELMRPIMHLLGRLPGPQAAALEVALAVRAGSPPNRLTLGAAVLNLLAAATESGAPVLVLVDDAQWVDAASAQVLIFVAHRLAADAILILVADRAEYASGFVQSGLDHRALPRLSPAQSQELAVLAAGQPLDQEELHRLYDATAGNPLGIVELATMGPLSVLGPVAALTPRLERAFVHRIEQLSPHTRTAAIVTAASSFGEHRVILAALSTLKVDAGVLTDLEAAGILSVSGSRITFRHPLVRSAVYGAASSLDLRAAHSALGKALASSPDATDADEHAWHIAAAAWGPDEVAATALDAAAERAHRRGSLSATAVASTRAAELSTSRSGRARRLIAAAEAKLLMGRHQEALALLPPITGASPDLLARAHQVHLQAQLVRASPREVHNRLVSTAEDVEATDPGCAVSLLATAAGAAAMSGDARLAVVTSERAVRLSSRRSRTVRGQAQVMQAHSLLLIGRVEDGAAALGQALTSLRTVDSLRVGTEIYPFMAMDLMWTEDWADCRWILDRALARARSAAPERMHNLLAVQAEVEFRTGRWDAAVALATEAVDLAAELRQPIAGAYALATWAQVAAHRGDADECLRLISRGREMLSDLGARLVEPYLDLAAAEGHLAAGDAAGAARDLLDLDTKIMATGTRNPAVLPYQAELIGASWWAGSCDQARVALGTFRDAVRDAPSARSRAELAHCEALLDPSDTRYAEALTYGRKQADPFIRARIQLDHGRWLRREKRRREARMALNQCRHTFGDLRASAWSVMAERELRVAGGSRTQPIAPQELTPQELQVAYFVTNGATNRESAAALYVSVKTIEYHLGHIYDKLGIRSRVELAIRLPHLRPGPLSHK